MPNARIALARADLRAIFPKAPETIISAFYQKQDLLTASGINHNRTRLAYLFANVHHETAGFTIKNLTENIKYSHKRMAEVWPNRFASEAAVKAKYGTATGWQLKAFDDIYGSRMGNRPGTRDGSTFIGRGGPQITGRDGYHEISKRIGWDLVAAPELATYHDLQPDICAAFWDWKSMNRFADAGNFIGCVRAWNGGTNGLTDRQSQLARITSILNSVGFVYHDKAEPDAQPPLSSTNEPQPQPSFWAAFFLAVVNFFRRAA